MAIFTFVIYSKKMNALPSHPPTQQGIILVHCSFYQVFPQKHCLHPFKAQPGDRHCIKPFFQEKTTTIITLLILEDVAWI